MSAHQYDEGHTVAGWTGFGIATVGTAVLGLGVCVVSTPLLVAGATIDVVSLLVTWALHLTGWGKPPGKRPREQWGIRVRDTGARGGHPGCVGCRLAGRGLGVRQRRRQRWTSRRWTARRRWQVRRRRPSPPAPAAEPRPDCAPAAIVSGALYSRERWHRHGSARGCGGRGTVPCWCGTAGGAVR